MKLNLGAGDRRIDGYLSVDIVPPADIITDLSDWWPWEDSTVDEILAFDIIEHIADRIHFMNEAWRILKAGARIRIITPNAAKGPGFFQDPTHKAPWVKNSFQYFEDGSFAHQRLSKSYGIKARFKMLQLFDERCADVYDEVWKINAILQAVK